MTVSILLISWLVAFLVLAFLRVPLWLWTLVFGALLAGHTWHAPSMPGTLVLWLVFAAPAVIMNLTPLRRALISNNLFSWFRKVLPPMSDTEREAIEAGTVWWDAELFSGKPRWKMLLDTPAPALSEEEQQFLDGPVEELCGMLDDWEICHQDMDLPDRVWRFIREKGFFGMIIPREHGGLEFSAHANSAVIMKLSSRNLTAAVTVMVPNSLGPGELLMRYGTEEQKKHYLPRLASGKEIPCFALTGPTAGSDAAEMPDKGIVCREKIDGKEVLGLRVTWDKRYITLSPVATVLGLAFRAFDPDHLLGEEEELGITCALVPADTPGVEIGNRHLPVGSAFLNGPTRGKDVFIPMDWVIGGQEQIGRGWTMLMDALSAGRAISLPALGTAGGKMNALVAGAYARIREQFGIPVGKLEGVQEALERIAGNAWRMDAARSLTLSAIDQGEKPSVLGAILKYNLTEANRYAILDSMDIHGGKGIIKGPSNYLAHNYAAMPVSITVEGANILTRSLIIFGQGAIRCHPYLLKEMQAASAEDEQQGKRQFDHAFFGHLGYSISNAVRSLLLGLSGSWLAKSPVRGPHARYYRQLTRMSSSFALTADLTLLILGGKFKFKERLSGRFADWLSHLYLMSACLKRFEELGRPEDQLPALHWACQDSFYRMQLAQDAILRNFPSRIGAGLLRLLTRPFGRPYSPPDDRLGTQLASAILEESPLREHFKEYMYLKADPADGIGCVEDAFHKVLAAAEGEQAVRNAFDTNVDINNHEVLVKRALKSGVITEEQATLIHEAQYACERAIAVDEFPPDAIRGDVPGEPA
jgi:acyl-CoA dehydrogenase